MTKRILAVLVVLLLAGTVGLVAGCGGDLPSGAVAKVGGTAIPQKEFDQRIADFEAQYAGQIPDKTSDPAGYKQFQQDVLDYMITYQIASQKAAELKITVTDDEVQKQIDTVLQQSFAGDQAQFDAALKQQGVTMDQLKQSYKESMLLQKVYDEVNKDVTTVADTEIQAYYDAHKTDYLAAETRTARHILLAPEAGRVGGTTTTTSASSTTSTSAGSSSTDSSSTTTTAAPTDADWNSALTTAQKVRADLVGGADWTTEAATYSDDPGSKAKGGDLGAIAKGEMVQEFEDAVFSLKLDEISQPVKSAYGYHVIQVTGITPAKQYTLDEIMPDPTATTPATVKERIKATLLGSQKSETWRKWIEAQKIAVGVTYRDDLAPATTTTTSAGDGATTTVAPSTETTVAPSSTTTAGATITTAAPTSTTAKP